MAEERQARSRPGAYMSAGGWRRQDGVAEAGDEHAGQLLLRQQRTLSCRQQHLSPAQLLQLSAKVTGRCAVVGACPDLGVQLGLALSAQAPPPTPTKVQTQQLQNRQGFHEPNCFCSA